MKRYRLLSYHFDSRALQLTTAIQDNWEEQVKELWRQNRTNTERSIVHEYGDFEAARKLSDFAAIGVIPFSVIAYHNKFLHQSRDAFVIGAYYPSLTAACALGERILNHLMLRLRDYYSDTQEYKKISKKRSFDNWELAIRSLEAWGVLLPDVTAEFRRLLPMRLRALHFNPETDLRDRTMALTAFARMRTIVERQFGASNQPWYMQDVPGIPFVKKAWESNPFVQEFILPSCRLVGYKHDLDLDKQRLTWIVKDDHRYEEVALSDEGNCSACQPGAGPVGCEHYGNQ